MTTDLRIKIALLAAALALPALACEPPATTYRRSALTPSSLGVIGTTPVKRGQVQVGGSISAIDVSPKLPVEGDAALHVAEVNAVGHLRAAVGDHIAVGGQIQGAHLAWSETSADGTPPLREDLAWGIGPNISFHLGWPEHLSLGGSLALTWMNVPWASWEILGGDPCESCKGDPKPHYELRESGRDSHWLYRASLGPNFQINESLGVFAGVSFQNSLTNIGFDNTLRSGSTISNEVGHTLAYLGLTARSERGLYLQGQLFLSTMEALSPFGPNLGGQLTLGLNL